MGAPVRLPTLQHAPASTPPDLPIPRERWRSHHSAAGGAGAYRVFTNTVKGYRLTITETTGGNLSGTVSDRNRAWVLTDESTLQAWMAALQWLERARLMKRRPTEPRR